MSSKKIKRITLSLLMTLVFTMCLTVSMFVLSINHCDISYAEQTSTNASPTHENEVNTHQAPDSSFIYDTPISDLSEATTFYDHKTVQVEGEVIGDRITSEDNKNYCWITLTSLDLNTHTIAIYMKCEDADLIDTYGTYGKTGTRLKVRGVFHLSCPEHAGISCMHADNVSIVEPGKSNYQNFDVMGFLPGAGCVGVGLILFLLYKFLRNRNR